MFDIKIILYSSKEREAYPDLKRSTAICPR